jgi:SSS family solute:Na+ symporter
MKDTDMRNISVDKTIMVDGKEIPVDAGQVALSGKEIKVGKVKVDITKAESVYVDNRTIVLDDGKEGTERVLVVDGKDQKDTEDTYAFMIKKFLPTGLTGIMAAALLAALMSTVSGALNSIATLFSYDLYRRWKPDTSDKKLVLIGRIATFVAMILAIIWSQKISHFRGIFKGCVEMISYIAPPITAVFLLGVFWKKASAKGAIVTLMAGSVLGFVVFMLAWFKDSTGWTMPALLAGFYLCVICILIHIVVSLMNPHKHTEDSLTLVWGNPLDCLKATGWRGIGDYRILAALLFGVMVALYVIFA